MYFLAIMLLGVTTAQAQLTAQSSVAPDLRECYSDPLLLNRNNLPPATINVIIDIIQRIEDNPNINMDIRQISAILLRTYRQDGIEYHQPESNIPSSANVLPYAPTFHSFHRNKLVLSKIIPAVLVFPNNTLPSPLKCALHLMLSTTVDARVRGDENNCNRLSQYRALRTARHAPSVNEDVEIIDPVLLSAVNRKGNMKHYNPNDDVEYTHLSGSVSERQLLGESQCPLLLGVVKTQYGAVSAGNLIAGIAAGSEPQQVPIASLSKGSELNFAVGFTTVSSIYPSTLSGDLAEAVLIQGTESASNSISIGAAGSWNSTQATKHYMLQNRINLEMTDPEIRGDIDGFVIGSQMQTISNTYGSLRLSQLLDMYYNTRTGVLPSRGLSACNRQTNARIIDGPKLEAETYAFASALDTNMPLRGTITGGLNQLVNSAVTNFQTYTTSNLNDMNCVTTEATLRNYRVKTNFYLVVDSTWPYQAIYPAISYLLDHIEVGKYGSSVTLLSAFDGSIVVNKTFSLAEFHSNYTLIKHQTMLNGVDLRNSLRNIRNLMHWELQYETATHYVGGNSSVLLYLLNTANLQNDYSVWEEAKVLNETVSDLRILFATSTNQRDTLWNLVRDMYDDISTISLNTEGTNVEITMAPVLQRILKVGKRVIHPECGSTYTAGVSGIKQFDESVEPGFINFYSISPNYFFGSNDNRRLRISRSGLGSSLVICHSRSVRQPSQNQTQGDAGDVECQTLAGSGNVEINLSNPCNGYYYIHTCPFFHFSVQSTASENVVTATCTDNHVCRFPYNIRYQVQIQDFGCYSSATTFGASFIIVLVAVTLNLFIEL